MGLTTDAIKSAETMLRSLETELQLMPLVLANDPRVEILSRTHRANAVRAGAVAKLWRAEGRQTLVMHPEVVKECARAGSTKIPTDVFRAVPYLNPMVVFSEPITVPTWRNTAINDFKTPYGTDEVAMRLIGFMCYGQNDSPAWVKETSDGASPGGVPMAYVVRQPTLTHDATAERFGMLVMCEVIDRSGNVIDMDTATFSISFGESMTMAEMVDKQLHRFSFSGVDDHDTSRKFIAECYRNVIGSLMYLASTTLDAEKVPSSVSRGLAKRTIARKPLSMYRIGWTVGAALTARRQARPDLGDESEMGDIRHQQDPQHRRAHFKVVWTGPGRTIPKTAYVSPYWTHRERLGLTGVNTLRNCPA